MPIYCSDIQNDQWIGFIANATSAVFTVTPSSCVNGNGVQVALYGGCGEGYLACNSGNTGNGNLPTSLPVSLIPGTNYYLLIDGYGGDQCNIAISVSPANAVSAPQVGPIGPISGPATACPGARGIYSIATVSGAGTYTWTAPPGALIDGQPSPAIYDAPNGRTVEITFGVQDGQVCVQADNTCFEGGMQCKSVNVEPIPTTVLPLSIVCNEDKPYELPWGTDVSVSGTYNHTYMSYQGCDSMVQKEVFIKPAIVDIQVPQTICIGSYITVCGIDYTQTEVIEQICPSYQGCDSVVTFQLTVLNPVANILGGGSISCTNPSVSLTSSPSPAGSIKMWQTSTGTTLAANANGITVTQPATIILTVTQQQDGVTCTKTSSIVISGNTTPPSATASFTGTLGCAVGSVATLNVLTGAASPTFLWTGPGGFNSTLASPTTSVVGLYTVVVTGTNGCSASSSVNVTGNTTPPTATATAGATLTCTITNTTLTATSNAALATYAWSGPGGYNATGAMPAAPATVAGPYIVTVTNPGNSCTVTATATVAQNNTPPTVTTSVAGTISCTTPSVTLNASTSAATATYSWSGPGFTSALQNPSVSVAGAYTVTVTSGANGCTGTASLTVNGNNTPPNVTASGTALSCGVQSAALTGGSSTTGATFSWTGPGGFTSVQQNPMVNMVGSYVLTVSAPNGCMASTTVSATGDFVPPSASATGGTISCVASSTVIMGSSATTGATFGWTGPGTFTSNQQNPAVTMLGNYVLTVTGPNGCKSTATATVAGNTTPPTATATAASTLTCTVASTALTATSNVATATYAWSGPGGYNGTGAMPAPATLSGVYNVIVSDPTSSCTGTATVTVAQNNTPPTVTTSVVSTLSCATPNVDLNASTSAATATYAWSGPSGFTSALQNPSVSVAGTYMVTVTSGANGCTGTSSLSVAGNNSQPNINASGTALSCGVQLAALTGGSSTTGVTFGWTGPGTFTSSQQNPVVNVVGSYILTVTAANGCTASTTVSATGDFIPPDVSATGGTIGCVSSSTVIMGSSTVMGATFSWTGPGTFTSNQQNPSVTMLGDYILTVTGPNGCKATTTATVIGNLTPPTVSATGGAIACVPASTPLTAMSGTANATYAWSGPGAYSATGAMPTTPATVVGTYTVIVTDPVSGCTNTATASVTANNTPPTATTVVSGMLSCPTPTATLTTNTSATTPTFAWSGPNSFTSALQNPSVSLAGTYVVTVTAGSNGCTATSSAIVTGDNAVPNATAAGIALSCGTPSAPITGGSTTSGATFAWTGPAGFVSTEQNPTVDTEGAYLLTVSTANGCMSTATATVTGNFVLPTGVSATGGVSGCFTPMVTLMGTATTAGATYGWAGPGAYASTEQNPSVSTVGTYILTVTGLNGCTATAATAVTPDTGLPNATANGDTLNCNVSSLTLTGASSTAGATASWDGPGAFTSTQFMPTVTAPGVYTLTVTNPANGCSAQAAATVLLDTIAPGATATAGTLTCSNPNFTLSGSTTATNVSWSWTGPGAFTSTQQNPVVTDAGSYTLVVTNLESGCTSTGATELLANQSAPTASATTGNLTCADTSITLNGSSTLPGTYEWSGPNAFTSNEQNVTVSLLGNYTVTVTAANGCTDAETVTVTQDKEAPDASAQGDTLTCTAVLVQISANSTTSGATYLWSGPGGFTSPLASPMVDTSGTYVVTVTGPNGCINTATAVVTASMALPVVELAAAPDTLTCVLAVVDIQATASNAISPIQTLTWTGPGGFTSNMEDPSVAAPGIYTLVATSANGCSEQLEVTVNQDTIAPNATAQGGTLTCKIVSMELDGASATSNVEYAWTGPAGFTSNQPDPSVDAGGTYTLTVSGSNGCSATTTATVSLDTIAPGATAVSTDDLNCAILSTALQGGSPVDSVVYEWTGPGGFMSTDQDTVATVPGTYSVIVTSTVNGCKSVDSTTVAQDIVLPDAIAMGDTIDCVSGSATLTGNSATTGAAYAWTGPGNFMSDQQSPTNATVDGDYVLMVTGPNGCSFSATAVVSSNKDVPTVTLSNPTTLTCENDTLIVTGTITLPTSGFTAVWSGPGNFTSTDSSIQITVPGLYTYIVTNTANGCKAQPTVTFSQDVQAPQGVTATGGLLNCTNLNIPLDASTTTTGVTYAWTGPGGFTSSEKQPSVSTPGMYTVIVTADANGCTNSATTEVTQDPTVPNIIVTTDTLTCLLDSVVLNAETTTSGVTFAWTGPGITAVNSTVEDPTVSLAGSYKVTVKASSGCVATFDIVVGENIALPTVATQGDTLSCTLPTGAISATSAAGIAYLWSGPGNFTSIQPNPVVTLTGIYSVTVTAANGCTKVAGTTVSADSSIPAVSATGGTINCKVDSFTLMAIASVPVTWAWSGPNGFSSTQQNPTVMVAGDYTVTATAANGCSLPASAIVLADTDGPSVTLTTAGQLDCTTTRIDLNAAVQTAGNYTFAWTTVTGNIVSGVNTSKPQVSSAGTYVVAVTNTVNGCVTTDSVRVNANPAVPSEAIRQVRGVSCFGDSNGSVVIDSVVGGTAPFVYSIDDMPFGSTASFGNLPPGVHPLVIQDSKGCELEISISITEPDELIVALGPDTTIHLGDEIILALNNIVNDSSRVDQLTLTPAELFLLDSNGVLPALVPTYSFRYQATVVDSNGCKASDERVIIVDKTRHVYIPNIFNPESTTDNNLFLISGGDDVLRIKSFQVYDRWGQVVHEYFDFLAGDVNSAWDGKVRGKTATPAVFVYYAEIEFIDRETVLYKGDVMVIH